MTKLFYTLIIGVMLGYGWCYYHHKFSNTFNPKYTIVKYVPIAIDTTFDDGITDYENRYNK